jgi:outer membrane protein TolC
MRLVVFKALILVLGMAAVTVASAAEMTLDDCIALALKNRASIIASRNAEQLAAAGKRAAIGAFLPKVDASYRYTRNEISNIKPDEVIYDSLGTPIDTVPVPDVKSTTKQWDIGGGISFTLPDAWFNYAAARLDHEAARLDVIASEQDLIYAVKQAFYLYLAAVQDVSVQEEAVKRSDEQLKLIQSKFELGSAAKSDVLKQKVQFGNDQLSLLEAKNGVINSNATLAYTIGIDPMTDHQFATQYTVRQYDGTLADAVQFGLTHQPALLSTEKSIKSADQSLRSAWSEYLPKFSPYVSYGYSRVTGPRQSYNPLIGSSQGTSSQNTLTYGFNVNLNIFDGFSREQRLKGAKVAKNNLQAGLADSRSLTASRIKTAYLNIEQLKQRQQVARDNVDAATEDLKITQEKYNLGAATILDLLVAQVSLKEAQVSQISADFDLNVSISNLENAMGKM